MGKAGAAVVALGFALGGCATAPDVKMSAEQQGAIKTVRVAPLVPIPPKPRVMATDAATAGFWLGPIGLAVAMATSEQPQQFKDALAAGGVDVREIVREAFQRRAREAALFPALVEEGGDAVVQLDIEDYGLAPGFSLRPIDKPLSATLRIGARIATPEGRLLWQKVEFVTNMNPDTESRPFEAWLKDRALAERGFRQAAEIVVAALLAEFNEAPAGARGPRRITPLFGPDAQRFERGHDTGGNVRFESEPGGDGRCSSYAACGNRLPKDVNR